MKLEKAPEPLKPQPVKIPVRASDTQPIPGAKLDNRSLVRDLLEGVLAREYLRKV